MGGKVGSNRGKMEVSHASYRRTAERLIHASMRDDIFSERFTPPALSSRNLPTFVDRSSTPHQALRRLRCRQRFVIHRFSRRGAGTGGPKRCGKDDDSSKSCRNHPPHKRNDPNCRNRLGTHAVAAKREMAFVSDEPHLFDYLTVTEHLRFIGRLYGVAEAEAQINPLLSELELSDKRDALPDELSRGMKQKLAIACALLHDPKALLLDEPLTGLDPVGIRRMKQTIAERARSGTSVILSSHLLHLVEELCTRILIIQKGKLMAIGRIDEIIAERPQLTGRGLEDVFLAVTSSE